MDIQTRKIEFVKKFLNLQNEEAISQFEKLLMERQMEEESYKPMSIEALHRRIDIAEEDFKNHCYRSSAELLANYKL